MRDLFLAVFAVFLFSAPNADAEKASKGLALLIGNHSYSNEVGPLRNPGNDVDEIKKSLLTIGYKETEITVVKNASRIEILSAVQSFADHSIELADHQTAFFYYSGHGAAHPRSNATHLIPTDVTDVSDDTFWFNTVDVESEILERFSAANSDVAWIVAIDACRNELRLPTKNIGNSDKAFGRLPTAAGMLISYAADNGQVAKDHVLNSQVGPYARALAAEMTNSGQSVFDAFNAVRVRVLTETKDAQQPMFISRLNRKICFLECDETDVLHASFEALGPDAIEAAKMNDEGNSLNELAKSYWPALGGDDPRKAARIFEASCNFGYARSCAWLAVHYNFGMGVSTDREEALRLSAEACISDDGIGCLVHGMLLLRKSFLAGGEIDRNIPVQFLDRAHIHLKSACERGSGDDCYYLADLGDEHTYVPLAVRPERWNVSRIQALRDGCDVGHLASCFEYASEIIYSGDKRSVQKARQIIEGNCDAGHVESCSIKALFLLRGPGSNQNTQTLGEQLLEASCADEDGTGCLELGNWLLDKSPDGEPDAIKMYKKGCELENPVACQFVGHLLTTGLPTSNLDSADVIEGYLYYRRGCELGYMESCGNYILPFKLGILPGAPSEPTDPDMVGPFYDAFAEGCLDSTQDSACASMGLMFEFGFLVRKDSPRAVSMYDAGCRRSVGISCALLGLLLLESEATSNQGKAYLNKAQRISPEIDWIQLFLN